MSPVKAFFFTAVPVLTACAAVTPHENADQISIVKPEHTADCTKITTTNVGVTNKVGVYNRSDEVVENDLITLGKNRATEIGGDTIVVKEPMKDGKMSFDIYKCGQ